MKTGKRNQRAKRLPQPERLAKHETGEHHRHDRRQRHDDAGRGGVGVVEAMVDHTLAQRQADRPHGDDLHGARSQKPDHRAVMTVHNRQQDGASKRQPPEAEAPGRHFRRHPFGRDIDTSRKQPAQDGGRIAGQGGYGAHGLRGLMRYRRCLHVMPPSMISAGQHNLCRWVVHPF